MREIKYDEKRVSDMISFLEYAKEYRYMYFLTDKSLENEFFNKCNYILLKSDVLLFNNKYVQLFEIITKILSHYKDVNAFYDIRCLMDIRSKYLDLVHDGDMNKEYDISKISKYIIAYAYYNNMPMYEVDNMLSYLYNNYSEVLDWCIMNNGLSNASFEYYNNKSNRIYSTIKKNFYMHALNYLVSKTSNKQIIK